MPSCLRTPEERKHRSFRTRHEGITRKVKQLNQLTGAQSAFICIYNGQKFYSGSKDVLATLGIPIPDTKSEKIAKSSLAPVVSILPKDTIMLAPSIPVPQEHLAKQADIELFSKEICPLPDKPPKTQGSGLMNWAIEYFGME